MGVGADLVKIGGKGAFAFLFAHHRRIGQDGRGKIKADGLPPQMFSVHMQSPICVLG